MEARMARLKSEFLERVDEFCDRVIHVAAALEPRCSRRIIDQLVGSGTSVGANLYEADEAMSRSDFVKSACISVKELNETRFWIRLIARQGWPTPTRLQPLQHELLELKKILGTMISRTKAGALSRGRTGQRPRI
jgi:four helix bundle protein